MLKILKNLLIVVGVIGAVIFVQGVVNRQRIDNMMADALPLIPDKCAEAYAKFEPAYAIGNFRSTGGLRSAEKLLFDTMRDTLVESALAGNPADGSIYLRLADALAIMDKARKEHGSRLEQHQLAILKALGDNRDALSRRLAIGAWDDILRSLADIRKRGVVASGGMIDLEKMERDFAAVDRRPIYIRQLREGGEAALINGAAAVGATPATPDALTAAMPSMPDPDGYVAADTAFRTAQAAPRAYVSMFKGEAPPPMLEVLSAKASYNLAALRTMHLIAIPPAKQMDVPSDYLVHLYVKPSTNAELPTEAEMLGSLTEAIFADYRRAIAEAQAGKLSGAERDLVLALSHWGNARFAKMMARPLAPDAARLYQESRDAATKDPACAAAIGQLEKSTGLVLLVR